MPFDTELLEAMPDTIGHAPFLGRDTNGNPTYGSVVTGIRANVTRTQTRGRRPLAPENQKGKNPSPAGSIIVAPRGVKPNDKIILPSGAEAFVAEVTTYGDPDVPGDDYIEEFDYVIER